MSEQLGSLIIDLETTEISAEERELLAHPLVGGVILFTRNYAAYDQLQALCQAIRATRKMDILIMVDQEGGRVQRFRDQFTRLPPLSSFGTLYVKSAQIACEYAKECGWLMAKELLGVGIDNSLAPVIDLNKKACPAIGDRAFHSDPEIVIKLAVSYMTGMKEAGMTAVGKHFPGHGSALIDSHLDLPFDERTLPELEKADTSSFISLIQNGLAAIMAAHIVFKKIDTAPVTYSSVWLKEILRKKYGFQGLVLSDDLNMAGANISLNYVDRFHIAREAGCDFALLCNNRKATIQVLDNTKPDAHVLPFSRWKELRGVVHHAAIPLKESARWQKVQTYLREINEMQQI